MAKGSQLSQLKTALSQAGVTRQQQPSKKRKRPGSSQQPDKDKKAAKLQEIHEKLNPFDVKVTKLKHDVGGRKIKGIVGRPAQTKQAGLEQRKKTLLKEYQDKHHTGGIVDRRFGENDPTMTPEERMLERFTRERQRASKGVAFNLDDEDELTHYGQSLSKLDDFDGAGLGLDDEDDEDVGQIDGQIVKNVHFGGFSDDEDGEDDLEGQPERKKTKAEVMAEVMAKSKEHKALRQISRQQDDELRHELDNELDSIRSLLFAPDPSLIPLEAATLPALPSKEPSEIASANADPRQAKDQSYDKYVRELVFDKRAQPKDRTKTEEEMALEEKKRLEKAERRRVRRMNGEEDVDSEEEEVRQRAKRAKERRGDDLEDDFADEGEAWAGLGAGLGDSQEKQDEEDGDEDDEVESGDESESGEGSDSSDGEEEEDYDSDASEDEADGSEQEQLVAAPTTSKRKRATTGRKELPFTFPCPSNHEEFLEIVDDIDDTDIPTAVQRIRTLHHPSLAEDNKFKLQTLSAVLVDYILYITSPPTPRFTLLAGLLPHLSALSRAYPLQSAATFVSKLTLMEKNLRRGLAQGALDPSAKTFPGLPELALLRTAGVLWPTSDMMHPVVSPARLLMGAYLGLARVRSIRDIASGLFLCTLWLQYEALSKRLVPEAVSFAINAVLHLAPHGFKDPASVPGCFPCPDLRSETCRGLVLDKKAKKAAARKPDIVAILCDSVETDQAKVDLLNLALDVLGRFAEMYKGLDGFPELYQPILAVLDAVTMAKLPEGLKTRITVLQDTLRRLLKFAVQGRQPLLLQAHKPIPIPSYIPKFEMSGSSYFKNRDPDHERNEAAKLRKQYKQEKKGAIRELRKDARFLAGVQQKEQTEKDEAYAMRMKRVLGSMEGERAEEKALEKEKMKIKKRAGKK